MAGHSKFKNIMHRKGAQDAKRAKIFTRLGKELSVAVKAGTDPTGNPRLRAAIAACKAANMPKENISKVLKKAEEGSGSNYDEIRYEGFGPGGTAIIIETLTDNRNRTASEIRSAFNKFNGSLGENGSVSYLFDNLGLILFSSKVCDSNTILEVGIELGVLDVSSSDEYHEIYCNKDDFAEIRESLVLKFNDPIEANVIWKAKLNIALSEETKISSYKFLSYLDELEDIQNVFYNFEISDEDIMKFQV
tara:strand:- start:422 stop:1165 length:744 start_codon:yes stop_codon:yes gene_type:complete